MQTSDFLKKFPKILKLLGEQIDSEVDRFLPRLEGETITTEQRQILKYELRHALAAFSMPWIVGAVETKDIETMYSSYILALYGLEDESGWTEFKRYEVLMSKNDDSVEVAVEEIIKMVDKETPCGEDYKKGNRAMLKVLLKDYFLRHTHSIIRCFEGD